MYLRQDLQSMNDNNSTSLHGVLTHIMLTFPVNHGKSKQREMLPRFL